MATYTWHSYQHRCDPQSFGEAIERLTADGTVTPQRVVEYARPDESPIHDGFEWDNYAAGEAWRKQQARAYLGSVRVLIEDDGSEPERVTYHVKTEELGDVYVTRDVFIADGEMQAAAQHECLMRLFSLREKYADIKAMSRVWVEVDQLELTTA